MVPRTDHRLDGPAYRPATCRSRVPTPDLVVPRTDPRLGGPAYRPPTWWSRVPTSALPAPRTDQRLLAECLRRGDARQRVEDGGSRR
eukprot:2397357-Prymnesium_polylepis.1